MQEGIWVEGGGGKRFVPFFREGREESFPTPGIDLDMKDSKGLPDLGCKAVNLCFRGLRPGVSQLLSELACNP